MHPLTTLFELRQHLIEVESGPTIIRDQYESQAAQFRVEGSYFSIKGKPVLREEESNLWQLGLESGDSIVLRESCAFFLDPSASFRLFLLLHPSSLLSRRLSFMPCFFVAV